MLVISEVLLADPIASWFSFSCVASPCILYSC
jgi:hypothetical protein